LPALEEAKDIVGLVVSPIAVAIVLPKPASDLLDNDKYYNTLVVDEVKSYSMLAIDLDTLAKYIYSILIIVITYDIQYLNI
jgi:hypothetical protein